MFDVIIIGGGAAGFYCAVHLAEARPDLNIAITERGKNVLGKVKVSGGGRCNVTNAEFNPKELVENYPRGQKELLGPFHTHCSGDTVAYFEEKGIPLKIEPDGRMFPVTNSSQTIIDFFLKEAARLGVQVFRHSSVTEIEPHKPAEGACGWQVTTIKKKYYCRKVVVATGSNQKIWTLLKQLGHTIVPAVPSLFTFNCKDPRISGIQGVSAIAKVDIVEKKTLGPRITVQLMSRASKHPLLSAEGPVLVTHWGLSGPAILKLSAWGARLLNTIDYRFTVRINWLPEYAFEGVMRLFMEVREIEAKKTVLRTKVVNLPRRLWVKLVTAAGIGDSEKWGEVTKHQLEKLATHLTNCELAIDGKSTYKEEFVTAGGVTLKEINFKTFESKIVENMYFAGEVIDVDAITGGFNFQNAWTGGYIVAQAIAKS